VLVVTFWETANVYQQGTSEESVGRAAIHAKCDASLCRLGTD
jgi:aryl-alcohol dehydrogenase-like predicted oxidoreductase